MNIDELIKALQDIGVATQIQGCTDQQIDEIKLAQNIDRLPQLYKDLLAKIGKSANNFQTGEDFYYPMVLELKLELLENIEDSESVTWIPPENTFVFWGHQGYYYLMFYVDEDDDPLIYEYLEDESEPKPTNQRLSQLLNDILNEHRFYFQKKLIPDPTVGWKLARKEGLESIQDNKKSSDDEKHL